MAWLWKCLQWPCGPLPVVFSRLFLPLYCLIILSIIYLVLVCLEHESQSMEPPRRRRTNSKTHRHHPRGLNLQERIPKSQNVKFSMTGCFSGTYNVHIIYRSPSNPMGKENIGDWNFSSSRQQSLEGRSACFSSWWDRKCCNKCCFHWVRSLDWPFLFPLFIQLSRANAFALFLKSQRKWTSPALSERSIALFKEKMTEYNYSSDVVLPHGSYLINLGNPDSYVFEIIFCFLFWLLSVRKGKNLMIASLTIWGGANRWAWNIIISSSFDRLGGPNSALISCIEVQAQQLATQRRKKVSVSLLSV